VAARQVSEYPLREQTLTMQPRCVRCDVEHYSLNVYDYSHGKLSCYSCGGFSAPMSYAQYRMCRWAAFDRTGRTTSPCVTCGHRPDTLDKLLEHLRDEHPFPDD